VLEEEGDEELRENTDIARVALGRESEDFQSYIEKIKNARPLEFESVQEDYEAENQSSFEEELSFEPKVENFDLLKSKINETMKKLKNREEIDVENPIICLTAELDLVDADN
jgi:hypothetical protein